MTDRTIKALFSRDKRHLLTVPVHTVRLRFYCEQKLLLTKIRRYLQYFAGRKEAGRRGTTHCSITILRDREYRGLKADYRPRKSFEAFPGVGATFGALRHFSVYEIKSSCLIIVDDRTNDCACVLRRSRDRRVIHPDFIIHILLIEWLRGKGLYFIHSSGVCRGKDAFLFIGPSGAGKTTSSLMGIQHGLSFLGDDLLIVQDNGGRITVHSYIEDVKLCLDMVGKFRRLGTAKPVENALRKRTRTMKLDVRKYFDVMISDRAEVRKIYFLNRGSSLKKIAPSEALPLLMNSSFFYSRAEASARHFELLCRLIYSVDSYVVGRNYLNRHFEQLVE